MDGGVQVLTAVGSDSTDPGWLAEALVETFPDAGVMPPLRLLGSGFDSVCIEDSSGLVFRVARSAGAGRPYAREARFLPRLAARVTTAIPVPLFHTRGSARFPCGAMGYRRLPGVTLTSGAATRPGGERLASSLASFLAELHRFPVGEGLSLGLELLDGSTARPRCETLRAEALPVLARLLTPGELDRISRWWDGILGDDRLFDFVPRVRHGDLWYENVLIDPVRGSLAGIIDFGNVAVADPAVDFATQRYLGEEFAAAVLRAYTGECGSGDHDLAYRAERLWELRDFYGLRYAIHAADEDELADSLRKLRRGPILAPP